jgi:hypothetical protein
MALVDQTSSVEKGVKDQMIVEWIICFCKSFINDKDTWSGEYTEIQKRIKTGTKTFQLFWITISNGKYSYNYCLLARETIPNIGIPNYVLISDFACKYYYNVNKPGNIYDKCCFEFYSYDDESIVISLHIGTQQSGICDKCLKEKCIHQNEYTPLMAYFTPFFSCTATRPNK